MYIPLNDGGNHWYLFIASAPEQTMYYVDTLKDSTDTRGETCYKMRDFVQYAVDNMRDISGVPKQRELNDGDDCGLYVLHFMSHPIEIPVVPLGMFLTAKHRFRLIASLILWEGNEEKDRIMRECASFY